MAKIYKTGIIHKKGHVSRFSIIIERKIMTRYDFPKHQKAVGLSSGMNGEF